MQLQDKPISFHRSFKKHYRKRILGNQKLVKKMEKRIDIFIADRKSRLLNDHKLKGALKDYRAFSVSGDIRIIYREDESEFIFLDIGTHAQVYDM